MKIIAPLFRDIGQPDTGLSSAVEEVARAVMVRKCRDEGHMPGNFKDTGGKNIAKSAQWDALRESRKRVMLFRLSEGAASRKELLSILRMSDGNPFCDLLTALVSAGHITTQPMPGRETIITITDAGRAHVMQRAA